MIIRFNFLPKFSVFIVITFIAFTIIGTISHELGHAAVAELLGFDSKVNYGSTSYKHKCFNEDKDVIEVKRLTEDYMDFDYKEWPKDLKIKVGQLNKTISKKFTLNPSQELWITFGGPAQTILSSFIGLCILHIRKKRGNQFRIIDWLAVFLSLFILREVFNFLTSLYSAVLNPELKLGNDEFKISRQLGYNEWLIPSVAFILGLAIALYIVFKVIPIRYRFSFIIAGLVGGITGFTIWFGFLGEVLFN